MKTRTRAKLTEQFQANITDAKATIEAWSTRLVESPAYAFTWSEKAFAAAAEVEVYASLLMMVEGASAEYSDEKICEKLLHVANERVMHAAKYPQHSTSPTSNLVEQYKMVTWANAAEYLEGRWM